MICKELTREELKVTNGCGSSYWPVSWVRLPRWLLKRFTRCCNRHDLRYQKQEEKEQADDELFDCLMYEAFHGSKRWRWVKIGLAELIYKLVTCKISNLCYKKGKRNEN